MDGNKIFLQIGNFLFVILTIIVNALANILPINNRNTGELSDLYPNLFVPSGITFSIWGIIYVLLIMFSIYQLRDLFKKEKIEMPFIKKISVFFMLASIGNITWIFLWHYEQVVFSLLAMILLFFSLLIIYLRLGIGTKKYSLKDTIFVNIPFSVYFGWISVATVANITAVLVDLNWDGFGISEVTWTILILIVIVFITILMLYKRKDIAYSLVIIWGFLGIYLKRINNHPDIAWAAVIGIIIIIFAVLIVAFYKYKNSLKK